MIEMWCVWMFRKSRMLFTIATCNWCSLISRNLNKEEYQWRENRNCDVTNVIHHFLRWNLHRRILNGAELFLFFLIAVWYSRFFNLPTRFRFFSILEFPNFYTSYILWIYESFECFNLWVFGSSNLLIL